MREAPPEIVGEQLFLQNRFWNALVESEREFSKKYHEIVDGSEERIQLLKSEIQAINDRIDAIREDIKFGRKKARKSTGKSDKEKAAIKDLSAKRKEIYGELKLLRAEVRNRIKPVLHELEGERRLAVKTLRQEYAGKGLYWGNYNAVLDGYDKARTRTLKAGGQLKFHRFEGTGRLTCQIQGGMTIGEAFGCKDQRFQIDPLPAGAWTHPKRSGRRKKQRTVARVRVGTGEKRSPIWFEIPITMHRPVPDSALIKSVSISIKKVANRRKYFLNITVVDNEVRSVERTGRVAAINFGWRKILDKDIRVAYLVDGDGKEYPITMRSMYETGDFLRAQERVQSLSSTRRTNFNDVKASLVKWIAGNGDALPEWFSEAVKTIGKWESQARLASLMYEWRSKRFDGDEKMFETAELWRRQDKHLWLWEANLRKKIQARRLDGYRNIAARLAGEYDVIVHDSMVLASIRRKRGAEEGVDTQTSSRRLANLAAPASLKSEIKRAMEAAGKMFVGGDPKRITTTCPFCNGNTGDDPRKDVLVACGKCGKIYDQDWAAGKNLLYRFLEDEDSENG